MPWCPNCKAEYQEGFTECSDCKVELVDDIKENEVLVPFFQAEDKKIAEKLVKFFHYSELNATTSYDEKNDSYIVSIPPKEEAEAKKLYQAFYFVERERMEQGESDLFEAADISEQDSDDFGDDNEASSFDDNYLIEPADTETEDTCQPITPGDEINAFDEEADSGKDYVMKADQYKDLTGTFWIFLLFGIAGLVIVFLNIIEVLHFFNGWIPNGVMTALFLFFLYVAFSTQKKAQKIRSEIDEENQLTAKINDWLKQTVTESYLSSLKDNTVSDEVNYIRVTDSIKEALMKEFGKQNLSYLDRLIEEYYTENF